MLCGGAARAHSPFDNSVHIIAFPDRYEVSVVLGSDAAQIFLKHTHPEASAVPGGVMGRDLPATVADRLCLLNDGTTALQAQTLRVLGNGLEYAFVARYPRSAASQLIFTAKYFELLAAAGNGTLVLTDDNNNRLDSGLLSRAQTTVALALSAPAAAAAIARQTDAPAATAPAPDAIRTPPARSNASFASFLKLGIEHILTGYDHLLFLCALLVACERLKPMLAIVTCFTLAHSVTLALAALDLVHLAPRLVEPLIAASIVFVGVENFRGRVDFKLRCGVTLGFGLIHGFGFAGALREAGLAGHGLELAGPLLAFNLGVECGQLAVAAVFLPLLFLARKLRPFDRYGLPATSAIVVGLGGFWLLQRLLS
jgi:hydrogenase/urease accessory protein HupE